MILTIAVIPVSLHSIAAVMQIAKQNMVTHACNTFFAYTV